MNKNFAGQPPQGGMMDILTGRELTTDVKEAEFQKRPLFINNCQNCNNMKNADGYGDIYGDVAANEEKDGNFFSDAFDVIKYGTSVWSADQERRTAAEQAQAALQIEQARLASERARAAASASQASSVANKIKAYALPIGITGVVVIAGIAAYFYFKKKKIS